MAPKGTKKVKRLVQSVSSITHSYTVLPLLFADGRLSSELFVVFAEPKGELPETFQNTTSNIVVRSHTSHIMTKKLMVDWFQECIFTPEMPDKLLLLVDQWTSFRDHETIQGLVPNGKQVIVKNIPVGATSEIQPLDVFFFRILKNFVRRIHEHVKIHVPNSRIAKRENILFVLLKWCGINSVIPNSKNSSVTHGGKSLTSMQKKSHF